MRWYPNLSPDNIRAVDVFLERLRTRQHVGVLERDHQKFRFVYDDAYLKAPNILPLGVEFRLTRKEFISDELFPSLADRLPDPDNPAYADYCAVAGIAVTVQDPIILLATIGKRGPSSFIFEPIYKESFSLEECERWREQLGLSMQDFANLFEVSLSVLQKMKAGTSSGKEVLQRLELYWRIPEALDYQIQHQGKWLHGEKKKLLIKGIESMILDKLNRMCSVLFDDKRSYNLVEAKNLSKEIRRLYFSIATQKIEPNDKKYRDNKNIFFHEIEPIRYVANYLNGTNEKPAHMVFCSRNESLGYDGVFQLLDNSQVRLEVTCALGEDGGQREQLEQEMLPQYGWSPVGQNIQYTGTQHTRHIDPNQNKPKIFRNRASSKAQAISIDALSEQSFCEVIKDGMQYTRDSCGSYGIKRTFEPDSFPMTKEQINLIDEIQQLGSCMPDVEVPRAEYESDNLNIPGRLKLAFELKNKEKYQGYWLIISIPTYWPDDEFYEGCSTFWDNINEDSGHFARIFVVCEEHINGDITKNNSVWDSHNPDHYMPYLFLKFVLSKSETDFTSANNQRIWKYLLNTASDDFLRKNIAEIAEWLFSIKNHAIQIDQGRFWCVYDRVLAIANQIEAVKKNSNFFHETRSHPMGKLTWIATEFFIQGNSEARLRLNNLIDHDNPHKLLSLCTVCRHLNQLDKDWVEQYFLPYLMWTHSFAETLWGVCSREDGLRSVDINVLMILKKELLVALQKIRTKPDFYHAFLRLCIDGGKHVPSDSEIQSIMTKLNNEELSYLACAAQNFAIHMVDQQGLLWDFLKKYWPKGKVHWRLIKAALDSKTSFSKTYEVLIHLDCLHPLSEIDFGFLCENLIDMIKKHPQETLDIIVKIIPKDMSSNIVPKLLLILKCVENANLSYDSSYLHIEKKIKTVLDKNTASHHTL